jgi:hypothetical protein
VCCPHMRVPEVSLTPSRRCQPHPSAPQAQPDGDLDEHKDDRHFGGKADCYEEDGWMVRMGDPSEPEESQLAAQALYFQQQVAGAGAGVAVQLPRHTATPVQALPAGTPIGTPPSKTKKQKRVAAAAPNRSTKKPKRAKTRRRPDWHQIKLNQQNPNRKGSARFKRYETSKSAKTVGEFKELAGEKFWARDLLEISRRTGTTNYPYLQVRCGVHCWSVGC